MEAPKTEGNQPEDGGWIEVPKRSKKNKDAPVTQQHPQGQETSHPRGGGGKHGDNQGGARAPSRHPAGRELTPEEEEKKKAWTAEEEALKAKVVLTDEFDWSLGLALAKKSPEPAPATTGGPAPSSTWSKMLFPGGGKSQGLLVSSKTVSDKPLSLIGGVHISLVKHDTRKKNHFAVASLVVSSFPSLEVVYEVVKEVQLQEPFISGFYSFRDVGALVSLFNELKEAKPELVPQLLLVDGPGISYRGFGLATHLGVLLGLPTVGVTKKFFSIDGLTENQVRKLLAQELQKRGEAIEIIGHNSGNVLGAGMRTTDGPRGAHVYISVGHRISLPTAVEVVREASTGKLPQPIHQAQYLVKQELLKLDPKPKNLPISAAKGGNNRRPGNNNREGGNNNNSRREGGFRKDGGNKGQGGKIAGGLPNGKAGSPNQDDKKRPRGPRVQGEGGNRVQGRGPRQGHEQGQGQQGRQGLGKGKGGNKGGPQRGPGGQGNNSPQQGGAVQQGHGQPQGNNQQGGKRTGGPRGNNRSGGSPKQGNVWTQKVPAGGAPSTQPAAASQPQSSAPAAVAGDQQRPAGKQGGKPQGGDGQPKQGGSQKKQQQPPAGEEKAQPVQAQSAEKKD